MNHHGTLRANSALCGILRKLSVFAIAAALTACAVPQSPQQAVFEAKAGHAAALRTAVAYRELPRCNPAPMPCHEPATLAQLQKADKVADAALDAAENVVRAPGSFGDNVVSSAVRTAQEALGALVAIVSQLRTR